MYWNASPQSSNHQDYYMFCIGIAVAPLKFSMVHQNITKNWKGNSSELSTSIFGCYCWWKKSCSTCGCLPPCKAKNGNKLYTNLTGDRRISSINSMFLSGGHRSSWNPKWAEIPGHWPPVIGHLHNENEMLSNIEKHVMEHISTYNQTSVYYIIT